MIDSLLSEKYISKSEKFPKTASRDKNRKRKTLSDKERQVFKVIQKEKETKLPYLNSITGIPRNRIDEITDSLKAKGYIEKGRREGIGIIVRLKDYDKTKAGELKKDLQKIKQSNIMTSGKKILKQQIVYELNFIFNEICKKLSWDNKVIDRFQKKNKIYHHAVLPLSEVYRKEPKAYNSLMDEIVIATGCSRDIIAKVITDIKIDFYPFGWCFHDYPFGKLGNMFYHLENTKEIFDYLLAGGKLEDLFKPVKEPSKD